MDYQNNEGWQRLFQKTEQSLTESEPPAKAAAYSAGDLAGCIDHTLLKLDATQSQIDTLCQEAIVNRFKVGPPALLGVLSELCADRLCSIAMGS